MARRGDRGGHTSSLRIVVVVDLEKTLNTVKPKIVKWVIYKCSMTVERVSSFLSVDLSSLIP